MCMFVDNWGSLMECNQRIVIFQGRGLVLCAIKVILLNIALINI